jgi:8-oxo-dGTP pyrophosphatase MutT (NUDIX family)
VTHRSSLVPAAYVLLVRGGSDAGGHRAVLLQLRCNTGYRDGHWAVGAAGHVEAGESVLEAAAREAREELDVGVERRDLTPLCVVHRTHGTGRPIDERVAFFFVCRRWSGEPRRVELRKTADLRWFCLEALPEPVVPHERVVIEALHAGPVPPILTYGFGVSGFGVSGFGVSGFV